MPRIREGSLTPSDVNCDAGGNGTNKKGSKTRRKSGVRPQKKKDTAAEKKEITKERDEEAEKVEPGKEKEEDYVAPEPKPLETLYERALRSQTTNANARVGRGAARGSKPTEDAADVDTDVEGEEVLTLGKNRALRVLEPAPYWVEDDAKSKHRQKMTRKAFKGNKRMRLVPLSESQEDSLLKLIEQNDQESDDEAIQSPAANKRGKENERVTPKATSAATPSPSTSSMPPPPPSSLLTTPISASTKGKQRRRSQALLPAPGTPASQTPRSSSQAKTRSSLSTPSSRSRSRTPASTPQDASLSSWMDVPTSHNLDEGGAEMTAKISREEFFRQISEADSLFGLVADQSMDVAGEAEDDLDDDEASSLPQERRFKMKKKGPAEAKKNKSRNSVSVRVRRSSRLLQNSDVVGTVYQMAEVEVRGSKRQSGMLMHPGREDNEGQVEGGPL